MAWSNIYLELITPNGPILGEGLLAGFETSIELQGFKWSMSAPRVPPKEGGPGLTAGGAPVSMLGAGKDKAKVTLHELELTKRFDIASAMIHHCLDIPTPVLSASISVLHIKQEGRWYHQPGFVMVATDGYFASAELDLRPSGNAVELVETLKLNFKMVEITYMKRRGKDHVPTNPFICKQSG
jgi:type VI protein secretion system component Hcp